MSICFSGSPSLCFSLIAVNQFVILHSWLNKLYVYNSQGRIIQCAQCARAHKAPTTLEAPPHAYVKTVIELKFVIDVKWLKCIETTTTKKGHLFLR